MLVTLLEVGAMVIAIICIAGSIYLDFEGRRVAAVMLLLLAFAITFAVMAVMGGC